MVFLSAISTSQHRADNDLAESRQESTFVNNWCKGTKNMGLLTIFAK